MLKTLGNLKIDAESLAKINEAREKLGESQDALFDLRSLLFELQTENEQLRRAAADQEKWQQRLADYQLESTVGGAVV